MDRLIVKQLLDRLNRCEKLDSATLHSLQQDGYIETVDVTSRGTPTGQTELLFTSITEKGRAVFREE